MRGFVSSWLAFALLSGCGDDLPSHADSEGSTGAAPATTTTDTTGPGADGSTAPGSDSTTAADVPPDVHVTSIRHQGQPMVVDLGFVLDGAQAPVVTHPDPGVVIEPFDAGATEYDAYFRVRGLAPGTEHTFAWTAQHPTGEVDGEIGVTTYLPLAGYVPSFPMEGPAAPTGYLLFDLLHIPGPEASSMFVVDAEGTTRWHWAIIDGLVGPPVVFAGLQLRPDGTILYVRGSTLLLQDELGEELLSIEGQPLGVLGFHHDVVELPNGNFLSLGLAVEEVDYVDLGPTLVAGDVIIEVTPRGDLVWQWSTFDHLDPQRRRAGFDDMLVDPETMEMAHDWTHGNAVVYDARTDTILLSMRHQDWVIAIDRATGDVLWKFGDEGDFTLTAGTWPFHQHSPQIQPDGTLLLYDNGVGNPLLPDDQELSRAARFSLDFGTMEAALVWEDAAEDFTAPFAGDADRLPDGNVLVTDSSIGYADGTLHARIREVDEVDPAAPVWSMTTATGTFVYRATHWDRLPGQVP